MAPLKEFPASTISHPDSGALMIVDSAACELAVSYAPAITYKDLVKSCYHVMQYSCNPFAQPACPIFTQLFYRSLLTILQDISLPICMCYENDNPGLGQSPPEWLKGHYQTLCTNFRSLAIDKGVLTAKEAKVVHGEPTCDLPDLDAALQGRVYGRRLPVRMSKVLMLCPRNIKIKNRVVFTGENAALQNSFIKSTTRRENYIINGPYMKFLNTYHKTLFPDTKLSSLYLWHNFSRRRSVPVPSGASAEEYSDLALFVDGGSRAHEESNVIDVVPGNLVTYAKQRLNNAILKACGQTQFYISLIQGLVPRTQSVPARDYPHVLGTRAVESAPPWPPWPGPAGSASPAAPPACPPVGRAAPAPARCTAPRACSLRSEL